MLTVAGCPLRNSFEEQVERGARAAAGRRRGVELSFDVMTPEERQALTTKLRGGAPERDSVIRLPADCRVIAVASRQGRRRQVVADRQPRGRVLRSSGHRVGVLDADIYGHSIPHILGIRQKPVAVDEMIVPPVKGDLKLMSIGFFLDGNEPVMWRGPMLHRALEQFLTDVHWGDIDMLVVDMPPGTGDVSISLGQLLPRAEAVVVTTPQKLAQDVRRAAATMARKTNMRLLGVIENMTGDVFGSGGGEALAAELGIPLLGSRAARPALREQGDLGEPVVAAQPDAESAQAIAAIAAERSTRCGASAAASSSRFRSSADEPGPANVAAAARPTSSPAAATTARSARDPRRRDVAPAREGAWNPCRDADQIVRTLLWRTHANRLRPAEIIDLGDRVLIQLKGVRFGRLGGRGLRPRLFQIVVLRDGKIASMRDYASREDALAAAGLRP